MPSLKNDFNELIRRISYGRELANASFDPIYYLVFDPKQILQVKRQLPAWAAKLRNEGWEVTDVYKRQSYGLLLFNYPACRWRGNYVRIDPQAGNLDYLTKIESM